ncbi:MAG TPA: cyclic nucleotide-binding domain-containing protein [Polyangiaceae bacterium]|jgi:CRP-like cAMP-binding protein
MRVAPPDLPGAQNSDSPIDRALALLLANETEAALRWAAAAVERAPSMPSALVITCRLLEQMGRPEAAVEGFELAIRRAIDGANLPLAVAAIGDLRALGVDVRDDLDALASAFCQGSDRLTETEAPPPPLPNFEGFQPLSSFLTGPALTSKATQIVHTAKREYDESTGSEILLTAPLPLFSAMPKEALRDLVGAFDMITVPAGHCVIREGEEGSEAYIVARGELEVLRSAGEDDEGKPPIMLARLVSGALFGEMALLSRAPRAASVVATRPSILLVAKREALEVVAEGRPEVAIELAAHCRRRMVANLGRTSPVLVAVPPQERTMLVERFETRIYEKGEKLVTQGQEAAGLHLVASGQVAVVAHDGAESVVLTSLSPGETVGEVALVLRRKANADVIAVHPTVTLFLPREEFLSLIHDHPGVLHGLYMTAVRRDDETAIALDNAPAAIADDYVLL